MPSSSESAGSTRDELDRLALAEPAPIAFLATLRRFVPPELDAVIDRAERAAIANLPAAARRDLATRDAVTGELADIVLGDILEALLGDPAGPRARERLTRGWEAAVGQPRYGPATAAIGDMLERLGRARRGRRPRPRCDRHAGAARTPPWPRATSPDEDDALRVSSELASSDAAAAIDAIPGVGERHAASSPASRRAGGAPAGAPPRLPGARVRAARRPVAGDAHPARGAMGHARRPANGERLTGHDRRNDPARQPDSACAMLDPWTRGSPSALPLTVLAVVLAAIAIRNAPRLD